MRGRIPMNGIRLIAAATAAALLAGCSTTALHTGAPGPAPVLVNPTYQAGQVNIPTAPVPTLDELINRAPVRQTVKEGEDRLRSPAMRDAALAYGAQGGLAAESRAINQMLQTQAADLSRTYDFQRVMIKGPDNVMIMPPVISQINETYETSEAGRTLRVADTMYEIISQATFAPVAPLWQSYLIRNYTAPSAPPDILLPRDRAEREQWSASVVEGWNMGKQQAQDIFKSDLARLERDFTGMVRYKALLEEGKVSAPVVADARLGTTGTGQDMRVNDRAIRITQDPTLQVGTTPEWQASPTTPLPVTGQTTGQDPSRPVPACPPGQAPASRQVSTQLVCAPVPASLSRRPAAPASSDQRAAWSTF